MNKNIKCLTSALSILCCSAMPQAYAALANNAVLDFNDGEYFCVLGSDINNSTGCTHDVTNVSGSYFGLDFSGNGAIEMTEKNAMFSSGLGLTLDVAQALGEIDQGVAVSGSPWSHMTSQGLSLISS